MDEYTKSDVREMDNSATNEALYAQQQLLQQLYSELDAEREASASAASEALSMILRLQGEKASLKMEASQYKRMAEEKMCHAEEALAIFEDLIYHKELEIASLEFQVQAYRYRLLSMGCNDLGVYENKFPENLLIQRSDSLFSEKGVNNKVRSLNSLPQIPITDPNEMKSTIEKNKPMVPLPDSVSITSEENASQQLNDLEKKSVSSLGGDINAYWEKIKKLDERIKEISDSKDSGRNGCGLLKGGTWSPSLFSQVMNGTSVDSTGAIHTANSDQAKSHENLQEKEPDVDSSCSSGVQDIFEVPQTTKSHKASEPWKKGINNSSLEGKIKVVKPDLFHDHVLELPSKDEKCSVKTMTLSASHDKRLPKPIEETCVGGHMSPTHPPIGIGNSHAQYQQLNWRIGRLEKTVNNVRQEISAQWEGELNLLKAIHEQLKSIQSEMRCSRKAERSLFPDEPTLDPLRDAMLYFWL